MRNAAECFQVIFIIANTSRLAAVNADRMLPGIDFFLHRWDLPIKMQVVKLINSRDQCVFMRGIHEIQTIVNVPASDHWAKWINYTGSLDSIDGDADGVYVDKNRVLIDISNGLSMTLGRQMSQMSTYEVEYIRIEMQNKDDLNDNDSGLALNGACYYWTPTKHRIDALQLARQLEKAKESTEIDDDSFLLSTQQDYKGMRFNWNNDGQVEFASSESFDALVGAEWDLTELMMVYGQMNQLGQDQYDNSLWYSRTGTTNSFGFSCAYVNDSSNGSVESPAIYNPVSTPFESHVPRSVLTGLMMIDFSASSTDSPTNLVDDDYQIRVTVGVKGWSDF